MDETTGVSPLSNHSDGEPKEIGKVTVVNEPLKTNYKSLPKRYALAEKQVWSKLPRWKRTVIVDCRANDTDDRVYCEYAREIISLAECEGTVFDESLPEVPAVKSKVETTKPAVMENPS